MSRRGTQHQDAFPTVPFHPLDVSFTAMTAQTSWLVEIAAFEAGDVERTQSFGQLES